MNSAHGSCRLRSRSTSVLDIGGFETPLVAPFRKYSGRATIYAGSPCGGLSSGWVYDGESLPNGASCPSSLTLLPRLRSLMTHPGRSPSGAFKIGLQRYYLNDSDDWSTMTPGPIVEEIETFCRY